MREHSGALSVTLVNSLEFTNNYTTKDIESSQRDYVSILMRGATSEIERGRIKEAVKYLDFGGVPVYITYSQGNGGS